MGMGTAKDHVRRSPIDIGHVSVKFDLESSQYNTSYLAKSRHPCFKFKTRAQANCSFSYVFEYALASKLLFGHFPYSVEAY